MFHRVEESLIHFSCVWCIYSQTQYKFPYFLYFSCLAAKRDQLAWKSRDSESALTEPLEEGLTSKVSVSQRVARTNRPGTTARIPICICNLSAKVVTILPHSSDCNLAEVKVLKRDPVKDMTESFTVEQHQHTVSEKTSKLDIDLDGTVLSEKKKTNRGGPEFSIEMDTYMFERTNRLGKNNFGRTRDSPEDKAPIKEPYRKKSRLCWWTKSEST